MKIDQRIQYARATEKQMGGVINLTFTDDMLHISQSAVDSYNTCVALRDLLERLRRAVVGGEQTVADFVNRTISGVLTNLCLGQTISAHERAVGQMAQLFPEFFGNSEEGVTSRAQFWSKLDA